MKTAPSIPVVESELPARPLGPGAVAWYANSDNRFLLVSVRTLILQVAHPMVGAGVAEHSVYKTDPWGRLWRTAVSLTRQVLGGYEAAIEGQKLIAMHREIMGKDDSGRRYSALNPGAYLWVHATMFDAWRLFLRDFGPGLTDEEEIQLFDEWHRVAQLIGVRESVLPANLAEFEEYWASMMPQLENSALVQDLLYYPPRRPPYVPVPQKLLDSAYAPGINVLRNVMANTYDPELRALFGIPTPTRLSRLRYLLLKMTSKAMNPLPAFIRRAPLAQWQLRRTCKDPRITPEPINYPRRSA